MSSEDGQFIDMIRSLFDTFVGKEPSVKVPERFHAEIVKNLLSEPIVPSRLYNIYRILKEANSPIAAEYAKWALKEWPCTLNKCLECDKIRDEFKSTIVGDSN